MKISITRYFFKKIEALLYTRSEKRHSLVGPPKLWKIKREFQIKFLKFVGLQPHHYLLDIGSGTLRGGIPIIRYLEKNHYFGCDIRNFVLEEAKKELKKYNLEKKKPNIFIIKNIGSMELNMKFDYIWAYSVLIHMNDDIVERCLKTVSRHLKPSGVFYANVNIGSKLEEEWQGFPVVWRKLGFYKGLASKFGLEVVDIGRVTSYGHISESEHRILKFWIKKVKS